MGPTKLVFATREAKRARDGKDDKRGGDRNLEAKNMQNISLQEKFHRGILWGVTNISDPL